MKNGLILAASLAVVTTILSTAPTIPSGAATGTSAEESVYTATFSVAEEEKIITPGGTTSADLPEINSWGFDSWIFLRVSVPVYPADEVELEPGEVAGEWIPILTFNAGEGWEVVEKELTECMLTTVWFYTTTVAHNQHFTPLIEDWCMTNFRVRNGICGDHTYTEITERLNETMVERFSLQADGISGTAEELWQMVF